jgi:hypothetical protein
MDRLVRSELSATSLVVAIDCGKVANRVMLAGGEHGVIGEPASLSTLIPFFSVPLAEPPEVVLRPGSTVQVRVDVSPCTFESSHPH